MENLNLKLLFLKAVPIEDLEAEDGLYTLWGAEGRYLESFTPHSPSTPIKLRVVTDLDRLFEYGKEIENPFKFRRPE